MIDPSLAPKPRPEPTQEMPASTEDVALGLAGKIEEVDGTQTATYMLGIDPPPGNVTQTPAPPKSKGALIILYGQSGAGKTTAAGHVSFSDLAHPAMMYDAEGGSTAVEHIPEARLKRKQMYSWRDIESVVSMIERTPAEEIPFKCFIFDNATEINDLCLRHHGLEDSSDVGEGAAMDARHFYLKSTIDMKRMVRRLRDAAREKGVIIVIVAGETVPENSSDKRLSFNKALREDVPAYVDIIGYLRATGFKDRREISFEVKSTRDSKFRRSFTDVAQQVPNVITYDTAPPYRDCPLAEMVDTLLGGKPWPKKYEERNKQQRS